MAWTDHLLVSCEHGGNRVPAAYAACFRGARRALASHRGHDPGALELARRLARRLGAPLHFSRVTRLLVELNRSPHNHRGLFSEFTRGLPRSERERILARYYRPYHAGVIAELQERARTRRPALHLSVHSFTPVWNGARRQVDIGLLYDPARAREQAFCREWQARLAAALPELKVRRNQPYRGVDDGLTVHLRRTFPAARYLGIEIEVSQKFPLGPPRGWRKIKAVVVETFRATAAT